MIRALQDAAATSAKVIAGFEQPPAGDGTDDGGHVRVTVSGGRLTGCRIDEFWAAEQDGRALGAALTQAARRAAPALSSPELVAGAGNVLLADVLATQRYQNRQEER